MRILIINNDYLKFVEDDYRKNFSLPDESFVVQLKHRYETMFGVADFYSKNLNTLGHQAIDLFPNHYYLQKQWAKENSLNFKENKILETFPKLQHFIKPEWYYYVLKEQILQFKPDVLYIMTMDGISCGFLKRMKKSISGLKVIGQHASPLTFNMRDLSPYDLILSSLPNLVEYFKSKNIKSKYFKLGFESSILEKLSKKNTQYDVVHVGGYGKLHNERNLVLESAAAKTIIDFWGFGVNNLSSDSLIRKNYRGESWGLDMYNILYNSKITMTKHIASVAECYANNMTLYEATGVGTLLIADYKENLKEIFEIGKEIETYKTVDELVEKIKYYSNHEEERKKIALAGQSRTLSEHTYNNRMQELIKIIEEDCL